MFALGMLVLGMIEAAAGLFSFEVTMSYFGFTFKGMAFTSFYYAFEANNTYVYDPSSPDLGNKNLS